MKLHPFDKVAKNAAMWMSRGVTIHQQFNCEHCGTKQTMEKPNIFFEKGTCQECSKVTDIKKNGCNYMARFDTVRRRR
jgi:hypothetical protein